MGNLLAGRGRLNARIGLFGWGFNRDGVKIRF
jgi:hypothetical protein